MIDDNSSLRLDKWLWYARFFRSRSLSGRVCGSGRIRVDGAVIEKSHYNIRVGQIVTFPQAHCIRVVKVLGLGSRRGPASEATKLYKDLSENKVRVPRIREIEPRPVKRWQKRDRNKDVW
ncbi:MAG: RNA-binding protein S4 [Rhodospirillales bacterium]|nr:RNA-binding protein S4 [Rhodospirillales bacterium]